MSNFKLNDLDNDATDGWSALGISKERGEELLAIIKKANETCEKHSQSLEKVVSQCNSLEEICGSIFMMGRIVGFEFAEKIQRSIAKLELLKSARKPDAIETLAKALGLSEDGPMKELMEAHKPSTSMASIPIDEETSILLQNLADSIEVPTVRIDISKSWEEVEIDMWTKLALLMSQEEIETEVIKAKKLWEKRKAREQELGLS